MSAKANVRRLFRSTVALTLVAALPAVTAAQEQDLATLSLSDLMQIEVAPVFGASQRLQPVTEAPASVTIVTADEIARYGYGTVADILRSVRGFYVTYDRNYSYVGVRGYGQAGDYNTRILLLVDGHRMNDAIFDQAGIGTESGLDPRTFERVEIIRGPASSLYGTNAFFAVVNIITKTGADLSGATASVELGSFGTEVLRASVGRRLSSNADVAVFATTGNSDGAERLYYPEYDTPETNAGIASELDRDVFHNLFGRVRVGDFTIRGAFGTRDKTVPTAAYETVFGDPGLETTDRRAFVDAQYEHAFGAARLNVHSYVDVYRYDGTYPYEAERPGDPSDLEEDTAEGIWWGLETRASRAFGPRHTVTGGVELRHNVRQVQRVGYAGEEFSLNVRESSHLMAAFGQDEFRVAEKLLLNVGLRYDQYGGFGRFAPRVGVIVPTSSNQSIKYLYGNAFRAPNSYESDYYENPRALRPETINTHELAWERYTGTWLRTSISAWRSDVNSLITLTEEGDALVYVNGGRARTRGLDFEAELRFASGVQAVFSHAAQRAKDPATDDRVPNSPWQVTQARISAPIFEGVLGSFELQRVGRRLTLSGDEVDPAVIANLTARWPITEGVVLTGSLRNLFDDEYADPASQEHLQDAIRQDGRTVRVGLEWRFGVR